MAVVIEFSSLCEQRSQQAERAVREFFAEYVKAGGSAPGPPPRKPHAAGGGRKNRGN